MSSKLRSVVYGKQKIEYALLFAARKTLGIKVFPDGKVVVSAPENSMENEISGKVHGRARWILRQQKQFAIYQPKTPKRTYRAGETHLFLGRQYKLRLLEGKPNEAKLIHGQFLVTTKENSSEKVEDIMKSWYRQHAEIIFSKILDSAFSKFARYKIPFPEIQIKQMEKRWGSCTPSGKILLNLELIKAPRGSIEYVIIHELCHLVHHGHNKDFMKLQEKMMPDWRKWKERLEYCLA